MFVPMNRQDRVQAYYSDATRYHKQSFNVRLRSEVLVDFVKDYKIKSVADIGCGNGGVSMPLLQSVDQLLFLDTSDAMLKDVQRNLHEDHKDKVRVIQGDVTELKSNEKFDLVIVFGVLAHVAAPFEFLSQCIKLVKPGGFIALQNTDANHFHVRLFHTWIKLRAIFIRHEYPLNRIRHDQLYQVMQEQGTKLFKDYTYSQVFPLKIWCSKRQHRYQRIVDYYGRPGHQLRHGSDHLMLWRKED